MDYVAISHLRWGFVYQRPQHLLSRCARDHRVFFWEEPVYGSEAARLEISRPTPNICVATPHLPKGLSDSEDCELQKNLLDEMLLEHEVKDFVAWYYSPTGLGFSRHLQPALTVYDCMDELSAFRGAPPGLRKAEAELFDRAAMVFACGRSLYESKKQRHAHTHLFPSSIDRAHFAKAREQAHEPADQANIPHPRLGYCGVIDERIDLGLIEGIAKMLPDWHIVMVGPVVKISEDDLPRAANIHYLGGKDYKELPAYLGGWDVGLLPFALNESTRYISPTKTPEYLAAGLRAVSTPIADMVTPYGDLDMVRIATTPEQFVQEIEFSLQPEQSDPERNGAWRAQVDSFLASNSWDSTWAKMHELISAALPKGCCESVDAFGVDEEVAEAGSPSS